MAEPTERDKAYKLACKIADGFHDPVHGPCQMDEQQMADLIAAHVAEAVQPVKDAFDVSQYRLAQTLEENERLRQRVETLEGALKNVLGVCDTDWWSSDQPNASNQVRAMECRKIARAALAKEEK